MQFKKKRKPYEYEGEMVMQAPKNPYSPSRGKSKFKSGSGYTSSSGPYQAQSGNPYGDSFDSSDVNTQFKQAIQDIIDAINNGSIDGKTGERQIFRLQENQQSAKNNYVRNSYETRPQSPAMAQKKVTWSPYDSSGLPVSGTQLNQLKQQDEAYQLKMGNNPYEVGSARYNYHEATNPSGNSFNY
tara:strand:+ start:514 stop:1068 length:555 start_codon:yes stop_codon:yes gene_type:complete